jgi:hypothetical protein
LIFDILQTNEEFRRTMNGFRMENKPKSGSTYMAPSNIGDLPTAVDWRPKGYVTGIKNQVCMNMLRFFGGGV